jgi:hypothetical protein
MVATLRRRRSWISGDRHTSKRKELYIAREAAADTSPDIKQLAGLAARTTTTSQRKVHIFMTRGTPFQPGNKFGRGRPKGSKNKVERTGADIVREHEEQIINKAVADYFRGDKTSKAILIPHILKRPSQVRVKLPSTRTSEGILDGCDRILKAVWKGEITYQDGKNLMGGLISKLGVMEKVEQDRRIDALEAALKEGINSDAHTILLEDEEAA